MVSHIMVGSNDIARSKKFFDALFTAIGGQPGTEVREGGLAYTHNGSRFMVTKPNDGKPASSANGGTIGFAVGNPKLAEACFFFQAEDGIRDGTVTEFRRVLFRSSRRRSELPETVPETIRRRAGPARNRPSR